VHVAHLSLHDFRSYASVELPLEPGVAAFLGPNGQGKTNLVEAIQYAATQGSHRVATDAPLVRFGAAQAVVRVDVVRDGRHALVELEITPGKSNRGRLNRSPVPRARELLGLVRTVLFAPEDLALVKGDPAERRRFLDELLVTRAPRFAGVRSDYDRVLRQRSALLKSAGFARRGGAESSALSTLDVWDGHLARTGAELLGARLELVEALRPLVEQRYAAVAGERTGAGRLDGEPAVALDYRASLELAKEPESRAELTGRLLDEVVRRRGEEIDRGVCLVGPHRDDLMLSIGPYPARGYASQGESWSFALALRLASYDLLSADGDSPVLILDDVFAELDGGRREQLAGMVAGADQVLVTAAVAVDVPASLAAVRYDVDGGQVRRAG
jgi:DNA replication and repair protein RecF